MGSESDDETIISAIGAGAKGYLEETATPEQVMQCIEVVESGSIWAPRRVLSAFVDRMLHSSEKPVLRHEFNFTEREGAVLRLLVAARSNREIAETLGIEERTVKSYVARLMRKVGVENRIALSIHAASRVLTPDEKKAKRYGGLTSGQRRSGKQRIQVNSIQINFCETTRATSRHYPFPATSLLVHLTLNDPIT